MKGQEGTQSAQRGAEDAEAVVAPVI